MSLTNVLIPDNLRALYAIFILLDHNQDFFGSHATYTLLELIYLEVWVLFQML